MHIICTQENLNQGINIVEKIVGRNTTLPILNNILLKTEKGGIKLSSTNLEIGINCWIRAQVKEEGGITVPAKAISSFVSSLPKENLTLKVTKDKLDISCREFRAEIKGMGEKDFPLIPKIKERPTLTLKTQDIKQACGQVVQAAALTESRPEIAGVLFDILPSGFTLVATDTYRLARKIVKKENPIKQGISVIVPSATVQEFIRIFSELKQDLDIIFDKNQILFSYESSTQPIIAIHLFSRLIEGKYPDYKEIIPESFETELEFSRVELINKIKVVSPFSSKVNDIKIELENEELVKISTISPELGASTADIKTKTSKKTASLNQITFNYRYLLDGLENIPTKKVILRLNTENSPAALKPEGDRSFLYLIMPIKT